MAGEINTSTGVIDVVITLAMCILLAKGRTRINPKYVLFSASYIQTETIYSSTDQVLVYLIIVSINTALWTAVVSVITAVMVWSYFLYIILLTFYLAYCVST